MMLSDFRDTAGQMVQPYFAAFMLERGYRRAVEPFERDGHNCEYMEWNAARWAEFERATGRRVDSSSRVFYRSEFLDWLDARAFDHAARNFVEAA